ncbi:MAG: 50S ribosomal protein L32e [Nanoarchaeota archaeon]|nr:50S ribosomal protein L32e [Nanoarchaeota archaeon]
MANKIKQIRRKKPRFVRLNTVKKKVEEKWRKPKGRHGRVKKLLGHNKGASPDIGYGSPKKIRGLHLSGLKKILIHNVNELQNVDAKTQGIVIANIGKKKKIQIVQKALEMKLRIFNLRNPEKWLEQIKGVKK